MPSAGTTAGSLPPARGTSDFALSASPGLRSQATATDATINTRMARRSGVAFGDMVDLLCCTDRPRPQHVSLVQSDERNAWSGATSARCRKHQAADYRAVRPPVPLGPGLAGLPAPTPMPAPGTGSGAPCASFDPCTAGGGGLTRAPSGVIMQDAVATAAATEITRCRISLTSRDQCQRLRRCARPMTPRRCRCEHHARDR